MNFLRNGSLAALVAVPFLVVGGGACSVRPRLRRTVALGDACTSDLDCASGDFCDQGTGVCTADGTHRRRCNDDRDCDPGDVCDGHTGLCVTPGRRPASPSAAACDYDEECDPGDACDDTGICVADTYSSGSEDAGASCFDDADCSSDYCDQVTDTCV